LSGYLVVSAQLPHQMLIRVPVVLVGISELIWGMDGMYETIVELRLSEAFEFSMLLIEKVRV
jgi:hypothetical protein